jgi:hypothetical protein
LQPPVTHCNALPPIATTSLWLIADRLRVASLRVASHLCLLLCSCTGACARSGRTDKPTPPPHHVACSGPGPCRRRQGRSHSAMLVQPQAQRLWFRMAVQAQAAATCLLSTVLVVNSRQQHRRPSRSCILLCHRILMSTSGPGGAENHRGKRIVMVHGGHASRQQPT